MENDMGNGDIFLFYFKNILSIFILVFFAKSSKNHYLFKNLAEILTIFS